MFGNFVEAKTYYNTPNIMARKTYSIKQELVARFANALANPARVAICEFLGKQKSCYFGAIQDMLPLSKATVSQHLTVLKEAGLIQGEVMPPRVKYTIDEDNWELALEVLSQFMVQCTLNDDEEAEAQEEAPCAEEGESNE